MKRFAAAFVVAFGFAGFSSHTPVAKVVSAVCAIGGWLLLSRLRPPPAAPPEKKRTLPRTLATLAVSGAYAWLAIVALPARFPVLLEWPWLPLLVAGIVPVLALLSRR